MDDGEDLTICGICGAPATFIVDIEWAPPTPHDRYGACVEHAMDLDGMIEGVTVTPIGPDLAELIGAKKAEIEAEWPGLFADHRSRWARFRAWWQLMFGREMKITIGDR